MKLIKKIKYQREYERCKKESERALDKLNWLLIWQPHDYIQQNLYSQLWHDNEERCFEIEDLLKEGA